MKFNYAHLFEILEIKLQEFGEPSHPRIATAQLITTGGPLPRSGKVGNLILVNANVRIKI
jgi:hypothetical protein